MRTNGLRRLTRAFLAPAAAVLLTGGCAGAATSVPSRAAPAPPCAAAGPRIPWPRIGPGWELVQDATGTDIDPGPVALDLVGPAGHRYRLYHWAAPASRSAPAVPGLLAWAADKTQAPLSDPASGQLEQICLPSGSVTRFRLPGHALAIGYAGTSRDILGYRRNQQQGSATRLARYSPSGRLIQVLVAGPSGGPAYQGTGGTFAVGDAAGLALLGDGLDGAGSGILRRLPVPGTGPVGCSPLRWWDARTVLASCLVPGQERNRLWLVPADGARPVPLTPPRRGVSTPDYGDIGAWSLSGYLYLQALGACGTVLIFRQAPDGRLAHVLVPHTTGDNNRIITALGPRLLIQAETDCPGSESLLWFDPRTNAEQWLIRSPPGQVGVLKAVPFFTREATQY